MAVIGRGGVSTYQANVTYMLLYMFHSLSNLSDSHKKKVSIKLKITNLRIFLLLIVSSKNVASFLSRMRSLFA